MPLDEEEDVRSPESKVNGACEPLGVVVRN